MTPITPIINLVASYYKWKLKDLMAVRGLQPVAEARFMAIWLIREHLKFSWHTIAKLMKRKCHSSMMHAHTTMTERMKTDPKLKQQGELLLGRLKAMEEK